MKIVRIPEFCRKQWHKILHEYDFPALFPVCETYCATAPRNDLDLVQLSTSGFVN